MKHPDVNLILLGHGAADSIDPLLKHTEMLAARNLTNRIQFGYWRQEPYIQEILQQVQETHVVLVPFFSSEGYLVDHQIPKALGFLENNILSRIKHNRGQILYYSRPVGTHPKVIDLLMNPHLPDEMRPKLEETTLILVAHGTKKDPKSSLAIRNHAEIIQSKHCFLQVLVGFIEEEPSIDDCLRATKSPNLWVIPFFMNNGPHVMTDIPISLGFSLTHDEKLQLTRCSVIYRTIQGRKICLFPALGNFSEMSNIIWDRALEICPALSLSIL